MESMEYSPLSKLINILIESPSLAAMFVVALSLPILFTYLLHRFRPETNLFKASLISITMILISSLIILLRLGPPAGLDPVGFALLLFLIYYIPVWLVTTLVVWGLFAVLRSLRDAP